MAAVLPTKGNLMATKRSRALAQTGYELMDRKRNILVREMMNLMDDASRIQKEIDTVFQDAYAALAQANIRLGICDKIAEAVEIDDTLEMRWRSVMGVELPHIPDRAPAPRPEYGFAFTSSALERGLSEIPQGQGAHPGDGGDRDLHSTAGSGHQKNTEARQCPAKHRDSRLRPHHSGHYRSAGGEGAGGIWSA